MTNKAVYKFKNPNEEAVILGTMNNHLSLLEEYLNCKIILTRDELIVNEDNFLKLKRILNIFVEIYNLGKNIIEKDVVSILKMLELHSDEEIISFYKNPKVFINTFDGRQITSKTINQSIYFDSLQKNDIVFVSGAAGSGKTYLAVANGLHLLKKNKYKKLIITRPVVEAGEKLGFLPGDLKEKIDPYLIPIYDAIYDLIGIDQANKFLDKQIIEVAPLAYMRGRTLDNAYIILDEAQNATKNQMKMFLTRLGFNSKMVITGDLTQIDLPRTNESGLSEAIELLKDIKGIGDIRLQKTDVMRHPLVAKIIEKYQGECND